VASRREKLPRGPKRIDVARKHFALSAPRHTVTLVEGSIYGFDFTRAAQILTDAAARAGAAIMKHFHATAEVEIKGDRTPSEAIILEALKRLAPELPVVSEEAGATVTRLGDRFFLVDPLDGTKEFIKKRSDFTVNIALIEKERPRFGLVYAPARSLLAVTNAEGGAVEANLPPNAAGVDFASLRHQGLRARVANPEGLTAFVSLSHLDQETEAFLAKLKIAKRSSVGSSVKFLAIARGDADVYPRFGPTMEWDTAARSFPFSGTSRISSISSRMHSTASKRVCS
jgi:3'(2'), 5'-bisphosphate nucleotidase